MIASFAVVTVHFVGLTSSVGPPGAGSVGLVQVKYISAHITASIVVREGVAVLDFSALVTWCQLEALVAAYWSL